MTALLRFKDTPCKDCHGSGREVDHLAISKAVSSLMGDRQQRDVAKGMGISKQHLSDLLKGNRRWTDEVLQRAAAYFNIPLQESNEG